MLEWGPPLEAMATPVDKTHDEDDDNTYVDDTKPYI